MCQRATCKSCGKAGYRGCGMHVEQVLAGVPRSERCDCAQSGVGRSQAGARPGAPAGARSGGFLSRLRGGRKGPAS